MKDYDFLARLKDDEAILFKRCVRKLLDATFIVEDRDEKLYQYLAVEFNHYNISSYLRIIGYDLIVEDKLKVAMLVQNEEDIETVGIKRSNFYKFDAKQVQMLMVLWLLYLEKVGFSEEVYATVGDIIDKLNLYGIKMTPPEFKNTYKIFKRFSLIYFSENEIDEESKVKLYPTLQFCMDIGQLKQVMAEYLPEETDLMEEDTFDEELDEVDD